MSNHVGGAMLNQILHGLVNLGLLKEITAPQKRSLGELLWSMTWDYDCNWDEVIDIDLAMLLSTCNHCGDHSAKICPENGYCPGCSEDARQGEILWGEKSLLRELLDYRFGALPRWAHETMRAATEEKILRWSERLLQDASSLEEVFGTSGQA
jgi:hypothetical protein